ncbi:hypothetical protein BCR34DRAFT_592263 [Clohesyomyces aquaticus]|uniref:Alpha-acetolactate decarboxylase n=1 Tax=Clohesyomyces aquaticus TaxID=1231657 RepID=A0A1Y1YUC5_9PLEO|nr:hypothetical protein BCR34DRAFT_592263 [Clohesyomyces aquaticus]
MAPSIPNDIYQYSTFSALLKCFNLGQPLTSDLTTHGTFGVGVYEDGSLMNLLSSTAYLIKESGTSCPAPANERLAFAMVTLFEPTHALGLPAISMQDLIEGVEKKELGDARAVNSLVSFRVETEFKEIEIEVPERMQTIYGVRGTVFGFVVPGWMKDICGPRMHAHFLQREGEEGDRAGGRVVDFETKGACKVKMAKCGRFHLGFPQGAEWEDVRL